MKNIIRTASYAMLGIMSIMTAFAVVAVQPTAAQANYDYYDQGYYGTPSYNYGYTYYRQYPSNNQGPLQASCYPIPVTGRTGDSMSWYASAYGGNGSYNYSWTGTDGLSGYGSTVMKTYYSSGAKSASVTVTSGGQSITKICDGTANIYGDTYNTYPYNYNYYGNYSYNTYPYNYNYNNYYTSLNVICQVSSTYANTGGPVTWNAYPSGGNGSYTYVWSGTDNLYGSSQSVYYTYQNPGIKTASVTVYSNGQSMTQSCGTVNVGGYYGQQIIVGGNNNSGLDVACYADPSSVRVNQPVTWRAEVTGGLAPYTYTWTGSDGVSGTDSTVLKYYASTGDKSAIVSIKSADGKTATRACSTSVTVRSATNTTVQPIREPARQAEVQPTTSNDSNGLSAAALFSLKNVPWGWVAILIILVLFATVVYLIFNRPKI